uniref:Protein C10 n=1 Tax=Florenciella parvula TaxID=236787 RepID=A0A7S2C9Z7_9STRA|mmetsp:Transcript_26237/g.54024  ORF Transcript_26237/g.54024 Transcript_26237/m.54024 type:complete len:122 (+) Transcript_26237:130-495(+)|eukprot:CAMPEP_0182522338 /NCGR_PEP_ID=MMETSP1323-20130603/220_1 /TAXON_ID=236787 /ORGANISM="Florenciella parvula, Strain RCC1693" /LENGTH=121 /DNA_ID=CAMNT_0024730441 /DNA_START=120 /DNA_END=485 /DNA_ORIENTATION=+
MASAPPPMTPERAKNILRDTITTLGTAENKARIQAVLDEVAAAPEEDQGMLKLSKMVPLVTELAGGKLQEYGLPNVMMGVVQIQMVAGQDPLVDEGVQLLTKCTMGNIDDAAIQDYLGKLG